MRLFPVLALSAALLTGACTDQYGNPDPGATLGLAAGAAALGLADTVGDLSEGKQFDAILLRPPPGTALDIGLRHADSPEAALGKVFALASDADVSDVWVGGEQIASGGFVRPVNHLAPAGRRTP